MRLLPLGILRVLCLLPVVMMPPSGAASSQLMVAAGDHDRENVIVSFQLPETAASARALRTADGETLPIQVDARGEATFILNHLAKGQSLQLELVGASIANSPQHVTATRDGSRLRLQDDRHPPLHYQAEAGPLPRDDIKPVFLRGGYLHPILSPSGRRVSDDYPPNHLHHHGIWFAWTKTEFEGRHPDFWNMGDLKGTVEFEGVDDLWSGPVHAGLRAHYEYRDFTGAQHPVALRENWEVRLYHVPESDAPYALFDLVSSQQCATDQPLVLPTYHYGGMGFRGNQLWDGKDRAFFLTSEGITNRVEAHATRSRWCYVGGFVDGQLTGIVILCHPKNYRYPQPMRIHPDEPFFCYAPQQLGGMKISPGEPYISKYRYIVFDGPPNRDRIEAWFHDYAKPPTVEVTAGKPASN